MIRTYDQQINSQLLNNLNADLSKVIDAKETAFWNAAKALLTTEYRSRLEPYEAVEQLNQRVQELKALRTAAGLLSRAELDVMQQERDSSAAQ